MRSRLRFAQAIARRIKGPYETLGRLDARLHHLQTRLHVLEGLQASAARAADVQSRFAHVENLLTASGADLQTRSQSLFELVAQTHGLGAATHALLNDEIRSVLRAVVAEESANRRRLYSLRAHADYAAPWTEARPLVTVTVTTRDRAHLLATRSLPSILAQTHGELEVIVVGDNADEATAEAVRGLDDPRLVYRNLSQRLHLSDDPSKRWLVGATMARNEAVRLARGRWLVCFDDDDAMRPDCVERLIEHARENQLEAVYGQARFHRQGEQPFTIGGFPPELGQFTWASGMYHAGLRFLEREIFAADLGVPGDWFLAERMLRAGVRFGMVDAVLSDVYPSALNLLRPLEGAEADIPAI